MGHKEQEWDIRKILCPEHFNQYYSHILYFKT